MSIDPLSGAHAPGDPELPFADQTNRSPERSPTSANAVVKRLRALLAEAWVDSDEERAILDELRALTPQALDAALGALDLDRLVGALDDRLLGDDNRSALLNLLVRERVDALSIPTRARLITALQRTHTGDPEQRAIRDLLLATRGQALTALKNAIDAGDDPNDLEKLVFHDLSDRRHRRAVLDHFAREAKGHARGETKIYSDIDDTFYASLNDERYPRGTIYPGVRAFYAEIDRTRTHGEAREGDLAFITARPTDPFGAIERYTHRALSARGAPEAAIVTGPLALNHDAMASGKLENFRRVRALYPEYDALIVGDSGQGDMQFGADAVEHLGAGLRAVLIHDVRGLDDAARAEQARRGVQLFDTYAGAAAYAFDAGLLDEAALRRVAEATIAELGAIRFDDPAKRRARFDELRRDIERVNARLRPSLRLPLPSA